MVGPSMISQAYFHSMGGPYASFGFKGRNTTGQVSQYCPVYNLQLILASGVERWIRLLRISGCLGTRDWEVGCSHPGPGSCFTSFLGGDRIYIFFFPLSILISYSLKSILSDIPKALPACFLVPCAWNILFPSFIPKVMFVLDSEVCFLHAIER